MDVDKGARENTGKPSRTMKLIRYEDNAGTELRVAVQRRRAEAILKGV